MNHSLESHFLILSHLNSKAGPWTDVVWRISLHVEGYFRVKLTVRQVTSLSTHSVGAGAGGRLREDYLLRKFFCHKISSCFFSRTTKVPMAHCFQNKKRRHWTQRWGCWEGFIVGEVAHHRSQEHHHLWNQIGWGSHPRTVEFLSTKWADFSHLQDQDNT